MGVMGLSEREEEGEGELDVLERDDTEGGRVDMSLGEEIFLLGVHGSDVDTGSSGRPSEIWELDGIVFRRGIDLSERERGWRMADQNWPVEGVVSDDDVEACFSSDHAGGALCTVRVLVVDTVRDNEETVGLW